MIYRVDMITTLLVEAESISDAKIIAFQNLSGEVNNGTSHWENVEEITQKSQLNADELKSLPWRSWKRSDDPEFTVAELIKDKSTDL